MLRRCLYVATRLQQHPLQLCHPPFGSPATPRLQATCTLLPRLAGLHGCQGWRQQQQQDAATTAAAGATPPASPATRDAASESGSGEEQLFDDGLGERAFIAPSTSDTLVFSGVPYNELPIVHIKATYNNTHVSVADHRGITVARTSCGTEGFKNAKKGTAIAAQTAGIAAATKALDKGMNTVRVIIKGIGPGRQTSIKGLQMGGLDIVSITDNTPVPHNGCRPRKARRL